VSGGPAEAESSLAVRDVRHFVPARDLPLSRAFYEALGWTATPIDDSLVLLELAGHRFVLQAHYVEEWAENSMLTVQVDDAAAWYVHVEQVLAGGGFDGARVAAPRREDWGAVVTYVWDPAGVLLHFAQFVDA
jgi:catechol 2,3-dioxygenase-like lactoylglutathione lyase family enzyme